MIDSILVLRRSFVVVAVVAALFQGNFPAAHAHLLLQPGGLTLDAAPASEASDASADARPCPACSLARHKHLGALGLPFAIERGEPLLRCDVERQPMLTSRPSPDRHAPRAPPVPA